MRRRLQRSSASARVLRVRDFLPVEWCALLSGWSPATERARPRCRWKTWHRYLADYAAVRDDLWRVFRSGPLANRPAPFAERAAAYQRRFGSDALERATIGQLCEFEP